MIKLCFCLIRRPELSREAFQDYWRNQHAPLVRAAAPTLGIRRYVQSHGIFAPALQAAAAARGIPLGDGVQDFDGIAELWFDSVDSLFAAAVTDEGRRHAAILVADEAKFIDQSRSRLFAVHEVEIIGG
jgi:uncharacterized protein (TIGR02118 family)